ncbi:VacJ family lipoprotein [uncultured Mailhella sp.]|uniref:MlaA family lipoprotein n=1 Tax=uncultured Mailhella sp. TaxID=1981031 RepID=UPI0025F4FAB8|nr:VacJ family lipoprotein [uncultured Mailhella sp.]
MRTAIFAALLALVLACGTGCASRQENAPAASQQVAAESVAQTTDAGEDFGGLDDYDDYSAEDLAAQDDPLEGWNRFWFHVNDWFLEYIVKPLHKGYAFIVPEPIRNGVSNFAHNVAFPVRMLNSLLQGEFAQAGVEFDRSVVNFMVSLGFADVASQSQPLYPYHPETENFDYTLGVWGVPDGPYFIIPFLGPSTVRGAVGETGDAFMKPQYYALDWEVSTASSVYFAFNGADALYKPYDQITESALEPYVALRNAYLNMRKNRLQRMTFSSNTQD